MRISISTKVIFLTIGLLMIATGSFIYESRSLLTKEMTERESLTNAVLTSQKRNDVRNALDKTVQSIDNLSGLLLNAFTQESNSKDTVLMQKTLNEIDQKFNSNSFLVSIEIYKVSAFDVDLVVRKVKDKFFSDNHVPSTYIETLRKNDPFPIKTVAQNRKNRSIKNSSFPNGPALISVGIPVAQDANEVVTHVAVAEFQIGLLQEIFSEKSERTLFLTDNNGLTLAHINERMVLDRTDNKSSAFVQLALQEGSMSSEVQQKKFIDHEQKEWLGSFTRVPEYGLILFSQIEKDKILEVGQQIGRQAIRTAGLIIGISLFLMFLFSISITEPIEKLASIIKLVSKGNFEVRARHKVRSKDEVGDLAIAFDHMTDGLKERDKVKSLFGKFHGTLIAEDILKKDIGRGGSKKSVTIFFSDIRGFTEYSETHSPEQVVSMLNEYFDVMVKIIHRNHGVVDKFIGDAIMAIWGAPKENPKDTHFAVMACLEMRKALAELNQKRQQRGLPVLYIGMGLHTGSVVSGIMGSSEKLEYTVIGDTVNLSSRIESSTKLFGVDFLVSEEVALKVGDDFLFELAGEAKVKGINHNIKLYTVKGYKSHNGDYIEIQTPYTHYKPSSDLKARVS